MGGGGLISLWLYKENNKLRDWKSVFTLHIPPELHTLMTSLFNFFNPSKKHSFGCAANRKSQISAPLLCVCMCIYIFTLTWSFSRNIWLIYYLMQTYYLKNIYSYCGHWAWFVYLWLPLNLIHFSCIWLRHYETIACN
jgi:hypothetical protein